MIRHHYETQDESYQDKCYVGWVKPYHTCTSRWLSLGMNMNNCAIKPHRKD